MNPSRLAEPRPLPLVSHPSTGGLDGGAGKPRRFAALCSATEAAFEVFTAPFVEEPLEGEERGEVLKRITGRLERVNEPIGHRDQGLVVASPLGIGIPVVEAESAGDQGLFGLLTQRHWNPSLLDGAGLYPVSGAGTNRQDWAKSGAGASRSLGRPRADRWGAGSILGGIRPEQILGVVRPRLTSIRRLTRTSASRGSWASIV